MNKPELQKLRRKVKETTERDLIKDAIRARKFSGAETLEHGIDLINFVMKINKETKANMI